MSFSPMHCLAALLAATLCSFALAAPPGDANLLVEHEITEIGADGVRRNIRFQERVYRRANLVWVERVLPGGAHSGAEHAKGEHEHKHLDLAAAARLITQEPNKPVSIRLVNEHDRVVVNVPPAEYGNIGFDGSWVNAWHLLDPKQLTNMQPVAGKAQTYQLKKADLTLRVEWDKNGEFPRRVESTTASGNRHKLMLVRDLSAPKTAPWKGIEAYAQKEYSDYLD